MKKFVSFAMVLIILAVSTSFCCFAVNEDAKENLGQIGDYSSYLQNNENLETDVDDAFADLSAVVAENGAKVEIANEFEGKNTVLKWTNGDGKITFTFNVPMDGLYNLSIGYYMLESNTKAAELSLLVDSKEPFEGVANISLPRLFEDDGEIRSDGIGNEFAPEQKEVFKWQEKRVTDFEGLNSKPYLFALTKGIHTISLYDSSSSFAISSLKLCAEEITVSYKEKLEEYKQKGYKNSIFLVKTKFL